MNATINKKDNVLDIAVEGRLDTASAPELQNQIGTIPDDIEEIDIDLSNLDYIASSGLRVLLSLLKNMQKKGGKVVLLHPKELIYEILDTTGFTDIFEIID